MRHNAKRILSFLIILGVFVCSVHGQRVQSKEAEKEHNILSLDLKYLDSYSEDELRELEMNVIATNELNQQFDRLVDYWGGLYPDYYGGAYIKNRQLFVLVTCKPEKVVKEIIEATGSKETKVLCSSNSYKDLIDLKNQIVDRVKEKDYALDSRWEKVSGISIDEEKNKVVVRIHNSIEDTSLVPTELLSDDRIVYNYSEKIPELKSTSIMAGHGQEAADYYTGLNSTISFCGHRYSSSGQLEKGFVIAGHATDFYDPIYINGTLVGRVTWRECVDGGTCDAAFVCTDMCPYSGYVTSCILSNNSYIVSTSVGIQGSYYALHGNASGVVFGSLLETHGSYLFTHPITYGTIWVDEQLVMDIDSYYGDSGGPLVKTLAWNTRSIVGNLTGGQDSLSYYSEIGRILSQMNGGIN